MILASELEGSQKIKFTASRFIVTATMSKPGPNKQSASFYFSIKKGTKGYQKLNTPSVQVPILSINIFNPTVNDLKAFSNTGR